MSDITNGSDEATTPPAGGGGRRSGGRAGRAAMRASQVIERVPFLTRTLRPARIAVTLAPLPRCRTMPLKSAGGMSRNAAAARATGG